MLVLKYKIWFEEEGKVFGKGPYDLLSCVEKHGSLSEAAKQLNMSYTKAFNLIKSIEGRLGYELIATKVGGAKGGGATLTEEAKELMNMYQLFMLECEFSLKTIFEKYFVKDEKYFVKGDH